MKLWLSKSSEVPMQEQLTTQLILGIVSGDLMPGEQLPSTSELGRRFRIHPNTVRASYRVLVKRGWADWKHGSGYYVRKLTQQKQPNTEMNLDQLITNLFQTARDQGYSFVEIQSKIAQWLSLQPPDHVLVIEPDPELREILITEIRKSCSLPVKGIGLEKISDAKNLAGAFSVALYDSVEEVQKALPSGNTCFFLRSRSVPKVLESQPEPEADTLITVVSRWSNFLQWAKTTLISVGIDPTSIELRDAKRAGWERGLPSRKFIITDSRLAQKFPKGATPRVFQIIADESLLELNSKLQPK
jgi:GntR family transcriptional regulator